MEEESSSLANIPISTSEQEDEEMCSHAASSSLLFRNNDSDVDSSSSDIDSSGDIEDLEGFESESFYSSTSSCMSLPMSISETATTERNDQWSSFPDMLEGRSRFASTILNGNIYVFGGSTGGKPSQKAEMFSFETGSWFNILPMEKSRRGCSCVAVGNKIYVLGGREGKICHSSGEVLDTVTGSWSPLPSSMIFGRERHSSVLLDQKIYVFGGLNGGKSKKLAEVYDLQTEKWSKIKPMNKSRYAFGIVSVEKKIYVIGGKMNFKGTNGINEYHRYHQSIEVYNPSTDNWTLFDSTMSNRRCGCSAFVVGSKIIVMGGTDEVALVQSVESFDIREEQWNGSTIVPFNTKRSEFALMLRGNDLIAIGGKGAWGDDSERSAIAHLKLVEIFENVVSSVLNANDNEVPVVNQASNIDLNKQAEKIQKKGCMPLKTTTQRVQSKSTTKKNTLQAAKTKQNKRNNSSETQFEFKSHRVTKKFDDDFYDGTVVSYNGEYWRVEFDDGDEEDLNREELMEGFDLFSDRNKARENSPFDEDGLEKAMSLRIQTINDAESKIFGEDETDKEVSLELRVSKLENFFNIPQSQGFVALHERLLVIEQALADMIQAIDGFENDTFGEIEPDKEMSLMDRSSKLMRFLKTL